MGRRSLVLSLALHSSLVAAVLFHGGGGLGNGNSDVDGKGDGKGQAQTAGGKDPNGKGNAPEQNGNIIDKPVKATLVPEKEIEKQIEKDRKSQMALEEKARQEKAKKLKDECPFYYGGIGISQIGNSVGHAFEGYPAANAGIRDGDVIISDIDNIRGEVGTPVTVVVMRNGNVLTFELIRDKICVEW
jgi:C-terminal processing protease CtpA/Prc